MLRLCKRHEYEAVLASGNAVSGYLFVVRTKPNDLAAPRLGIVASKKALPRAVDRNRGKRLVRESFRLAMADLAALDIVVLLRSGLAKKNNSIARQELLALFAGLGQEPAARARAGTAVKN